MEYTNTSEERKRAGKSNSVICINSSALHEDLGHNCIAFPHLLYINIQFHIGILHKSYEHLLEVIEFVLFLT